MSIHEAFEAIDMFREIKRKYGLKMIDEAAFFWCLHRLMYIGVSRKKALELLGFIKDGSEWKML